MDIKYTCKLFSGRISTIREDMACYGPVLSTEILQKVLVTSGQYIIDDHRKYNMYLEPSVPRTDGKFTYELADNQLIITKISGSKRRNQSAGTRRKKRKVKSYKKGGWPGHKGWPYILPPEGSGLIAFGGTYGSIRKIEPTNK